MDTEAIEQAVQQIIQAVGENPRREGLRDTPRRIADMYEEIFSGLALDPMAELTVGFEEGHREMVVLRGHCERSEAISSFGHRLLRGFAPRNDDLLTCAARMKRPWGRW